MTITTISPQELAARQQCGDVCELIDVRTPVEFREVHVPFAHNEPLDRLDPCALMTAHIAASSQPLYVICRSGQRANQACEKFLAAGFSNVVLSVTGHFQKHHHGGDNFLNASWALGKTIGRNWRR